MVKKKNLIILTVIIIIAVSIAILGISAYLHILEEETFYESIQTISDIENQSDLDGENVRNQTDPSNEELKEFELESINATSTEIIMLQDLKTKVSDKSYLDFIDIQINRLNSENRTYTIMLDKSNTYDEYKKGEIGASRALALINDKNEEVSAYANKTTEYKVEADSFLSTHTDMKDKFNELGIDEDFLFNQIEEVKATSVT